MSSKLKLAAVVHQVNEVSLLGTADLEYWHRRLEPEQLEPIARAGQAQVLLTSADAKFWGLRFQEFSVAVPARDTTGQIDAEGCYLLRAFNSRRSFAWVERTFFHTPYMPGDVRVSAEPPGFVVEWPDARLAGSFDFAQRNPNTEYELNTWQGPLFLPSEPSIAAADRKLFFARLWNGRIEVPFDVSHDRFALPENNAVPFNELRDSNFAPQTWICGSEASHAKSKTYTRGKHPIFSPEKPICS